MDRPTAFDDIVDTELQPTLVEADVQPVDSVVPPATLGNEIALGIGPTEVVGRVGDQIVLAVGVDVLGRVAGHLPAQDPEVVGCRADAEHHQQASIANRQGVEPRVCVVGEQFAEVAGEARVIEEPVLVIDRKLSEVPVSSRSLLNAMQGKGVMDGPVTSE
jgi:hypothetical protein